MNFSLLPPREQLVHILNRTYTNGMTTTSGGNLSILDENGGVWITPAGIDKGTLTVDDIVCVKHDETIVGKHRPSSEYPFHQAIYQKRPDVRAIAHAHPPALVSFSIVRKIPDTKVIPQIHHVCGLVGYASYALPGSQQLGQNIANTFAKGFDTVLLENHGVATSGPDLLTAFQRMETLDFCARTIINANALGSVQSLTDEQIALAHQNNALPTFDPPYHTTKERELRLQLCRIVHRAYNHQLMTSTAGTVSARVDETSFLITPYDIDRNYLDSEDIVLIRDGRREAHKTPSRAVSLHQKIYQDHPEIGSIITAQPPHVAAYSISKQPFNTRTIGESYIFLRDIPVIPYGVQFREPEKISDIVSLDTPVILMQNDALLTIGQTVFEAFNRLEVADFTARSLLHASHLGQVVPFGEQEVRELEEKYLS